MIREVQVALSSMITAGVLVSAEAHLKAGARAGLRGEEGRMEAVA